MLNQNISRIRAFFITAILGGLTAGIALLITHVNDLNRQNETPEKAVLIWCLIIALLLTAGITAVYLSLWIFGPDEKTDTKTNLPKD